MTSQSLMRMSQEVLRQTWQVLAHSLRLLPERAGSAKAPQVPASGLEAAGRPLLLAEKVRLHSLQSRLWDPSRSWPFLKKGEDPHQGQASGAASPAACASSRAAAAFAASMGPRFSPGESPSISWSMISSIRPRFFDVDVRRHSSWGGGGTSLRRCWSNREGRINEIGERERHCPCCGNVRHCSGIVPGAHTYLCGRGKRSGDCGIDRCQRHAIRRR